jgi:hypothetical protein
MPKKPIDGQLAEASELQSIKNSLDKIPGGKINQASIICDSGKRRSKIIKVCLWYHAQWPTAKQSTLPWHP